MTLSCRRECFKGASQYPTDQSAGTEISPLVKIPKWDCLHNCCGNQVLEFRPESIAEHIESQELSVKSMRKVIDLSRRDGIQHQFPHCRFQSELLQNRPSLLSFFTAQYGRGETYVPCCRQLELKELGHHVRRRQCGEHRTPVLDDCLLHCFNEILLTSDYTVRY